MNQSVSLAERVARIEATMPSSDRDGRDQWDAINDLRNGMGDLKSDLRSVRDKNELILDRLEEVKDRQGEASKERSGMETRNAEAIAALTQKIDALTADMAVEKDSRATNGKFGVVLLSGIVSVCVALAAAIFNHKLFGR